MVIKGTYIRKPNEHRKVCKLEECDNYVREPQVDYCSTKCRKRDDKKPYSSPAGYRNRNLNPDKNPKVKMRECLSCDISFLSEGPWNRICPRCSEKDRNLPKSALGYGVNLDKYLEPD